MITPQETQQRILNRLRIAQKTLAKEMGTPLTGLKVMDATLSVILRDALGLDAMFDWQRPDYIEGYDDVPKTAPNTCDRCGSQLLASANYCCRHCDYADARKAYDAKEITPEQYSEIMRDLNQRHYPNARLTDAV